MATKQVHIHQVNYSNLTCIIALSTSAICCDWHIITVCQLTLLAIKQEMYTTEDGCPTLPNAPDYPNSPYIREREKRRERKLERERYQASGVRPQLIVSLFMFEDMHIPRVCLHLHWKHKQGQNTYWLLGHCYGRLFSWIGLSGRGLGSERWAVWLSLWDLNDGSIQRYQC